MLKPLTIAAMFAVPALALSACSPNEQVATEPGTPPPVWTGSPSPEAPADAQEGTDGEDGRPRLTAQLRTSDGTQIGTADFEFSDGYATVTVRTTPSDQLTPGFHGLHIHQAGTCEPDSVAPDGGEPGDFNSAGEHLHTDGNGEDHPDRGDLTALQVREDGAALLVTTSDAFTPEDLTGEGGTALIIHAEPDNFANIPPERYQQVNGDPPPDETTLSTGDAGDRVACGVIGTG